jgi:cytochrome c oxidase assembly protein subunit 15
VPVVALCLIAGEILMGGMVVLMEIPVQLTTVHFMTGLTIFLLAFYMMTFDGVDEKPGFPLHGLSALFIVMGLLVFSQAALGAYVRHSGAGLACTDFPTSMGAWIPHVMDWRVLVQLSHRMMGGLIPVTFAVLYVATFVDKGLTVHRNASFMLIVLCVAQILIGAVVVLAGLSFVATAIHLALALGILSLLFHMWVREAGREPDVSRVV